jgi:hypothetical protein
MGPYLDSAELYDPDTGTSSTAAKMPAAHHGHIATPLVNGDVLVAGGYKNTGGLISGAELYDPATGTWSKTGRLAAARESQTATLLSNGKASWRAEPVAAASL